MKTTIVVLTLALIALAFTLNGARKEIYLLEDALTMAMMRANQWEAAAEALELNALD